MHGVVAGASAKASEILLLAMVSMAFDVVSTKLAAVSCCRTVVTLAAARAKLPRAVLKQG